MPRESFWRAAHPSATTRGGSVDGDHDVVIVGGGLTGITLAALLSRAGTSVLVVEARHLGAGTTGGSTAKVSLLQGTRLGEIAGKHSPEVLRHYLAANEEGQAWVRRFCEDHGVPAQERPAYTHATTTHGTTLARREHDVARDLGLPVTWEDEVPLPFRVSGAVRLDGQLQVDPLALLDALAAEARSHGARIVEGARVRKVHRRRTWVVETDAGEATGRQVVLATNLPVLDRGGWFARMRPSRSYALAYRTPATAVDGMYLSSDRATRSLRDAPGDGADGAVLLVGGEGHTTGRGGATSARLDTLRQWTAEHFPEAVETHAWSAQDYTPSRSLPVVGPLLPGEEDLLVSGGYSKWGLTNAVAGALALSARILGGHVPWAAAFEPWRRQDLSGLPQDAVLNAEVGVEMARGWLAPLAGSVLPGVDGGELAEGEGRVRYDHVGTPTACARVDGTEQRVSGACTHLGGILRWNDAEQSWDCPLHGSRFAPDGEVLEGPATSPLERR